MISLSELQEIYDRHRFLGAFEKTAEHWKKTTKLDDFSPEELVLGGRLAVRLGGGRLSRHLFRVAYARKPKSSRVRYYSMHARRKSRLFDTLREFEADPDACADDPEIQSSWLASHAVTWAYLRDFTRAHQCIERAQQLKQEASWVTSCEADVLGMEDRWSDALAIAERAWKENPGAAYAARSLTNSLLNLGRVQESAQWLAAAASDDCQSYEIVHLACWHHCAFAETFDGEERISVLTEASKFADRLPALLPLADKEARTIVARCRLDIAELSDDHVEMERWAKEVHIPFYRKVAENLRKHPNAPRTRLPFRRVVQKHQACLPTSLSSALATQGVQLDPDVMAREITYGGTHEWAAGEWLEQRDLVVRFFAVTTEIAISLIKHGIAFVLTLDYDDSAHAVAVVGVDETAGTLLIHDPMTFRTTEYLMENFGSDAEPFGLKAMVAVPKEKAALLDELLPKDSVAMMTLAHEFGKIMALQGATAAGEIVRKASEQLPSHPGTQLMRALQNLEEGRSSEALLGLQQLLNAFPKSPLVRSRLVSSCRSLGNTALTRDTLAGVVERGILPGVQSQQEWRYPPTRYVVEYADLLGHSASTSEKAVLLLHTVIRRAPAAAEAWHVLADLLWGVQDTEGALLAYRLGACQAVNYDHYARAYCDALCMAGRENDGLAWLEERVRRFGNVGRASGVWTTWIAALESWGHPDRALAACNEALQQHASADELLAFAVSFLARMGHWVEAEQLLTQLEKIGNRPLFYGAVVDFHRLRDDWQQAVRYAQDWVRESPLNMRARRELANLVARQDGGAAALDLTSKWASEFPGHDEMEMLRYEQIDAAGGSKHKKYSVLLRRVKRNPEDAWAWRELGFLRMADYEHAQDRRQPRIRAHVESLLKECDRVGRDDAATLRLRGRWHESQAEWSDAVDLYMEAIEREPRVFFSYQRAWDCSATFEAAKRREVWEKMDRQFVRSAGHLSLARNMVMMLAGRFGTTAAEACVTKWKEARPDDPDVTEAFADLLLERGQGRTDAARAMAMLEPAVERYPHHKGLRFSLGDCYRRLGKFAEAQEVLAEICRRHPGDAHAQIQLAGVCEREGKRDEAIRLLEETWRKNPQNLQVADQFVQTLIRARWLEEAKKTLKEVLQRAPEAVNSRERAIHFFVECGDEKAAVATARQGVEVYPRGAYMWHLLGTTLNEHRSFAEKGEIEACFRRSVFLNTHLFDAADQLALLLIEQRRLEDAEAEMKRILPRLPDPSPAKGRLAWIHREMGNKNAAREEMAATVRATPWYLWGWAVLMEWLIEDKAWEQAKALLIPLPQELRTNTQFRRQRLGVLEHSGLPVSELDEEWNSLLRDFPEQVPLHLNRYDLLRTAKRLPESHTLLHAIYPFGADNMWLVARQVEVLIEEKKTQEALDALQRIFFAEVETSSWPVNYAWDAIKRANLQSVAFAKMQVAMQSRSRPTPNAFSVLCTTALELGQTEKKGRQPYWRVWFPDRGARDVLKLLDTADKSTWVDGRYRARAFERLSSMGYYGLVIRYWKKHKAEVENNVSTWAEVARALVSVGRKSEARTMMASWRTRTGVPMWAIANYIQALSAVWRSELQEVRQTTQDALAQLSHDHCARYLAHVLAEACALLGDDRGFLSTWNQYHSYFDCKESKSEWFAPKRKYLLLDVPMAARYLQEGQVRLYRQMRRSWRWKHFTGSMSKSANFGGMQIRWWILAWLAFWTLMHVLNQVR